jgi:glycosyltransferase involved in cell wall biosynthesis
MNLGIIDTERTPQQPPIILPLDGSVKRTKWSVMIPVYNCISYLPFTLQSVLQQDKGADQMQIKVIDDFSTDGDVEGLVQQIGKGRVEYFKQPKNVGSLRNFETCINHAKGLYVHILHGDDAVKMGFYDEIDDLFRSYPEAGAAFTHYEYMDHMGKKIWDNEPVDTERGILKNWLIRIASKQVMQPPAVVVKRSTYESIGSFYGVHYGEDWLMWVSIAAHFPVAFSPFNLANYRVHQTNISFRSLKKAKNIREMNFVINEIKKFIPASDTKRITNLSKQNFSVYYARLSHKVYHEYNLPKDALYQAVFALRLHFNRKTFNYSAKLILKYAFGYRHFRKLFQSKISESIELYN